ncbi:glycosyltransferase family 4 protein [Kineococcus sp. SYSU DK006]|uniref:glycosyltransferase family 4 protein n=1 Tax=Kineococcus sp. SYSU DK006 TaxID=3383127 RepID=UPI003D7E0A1B
MAGQQRAGRQRAEEQWAGRPVDVVAGGLWHAPDLARGLARLGCSVRLVTSAARVAVDGVQVRTVPLVRLPLRLVSGFRRPDVLVHAAFGAAAATQLRPGSLVVAWSSFAAASLTAPGHRVVVCRGSTHVARQREVLLAAGARVGARLPVPGPAMVALERHEYARAAAVTVPTDEIAADPLWAQDGARLAVAPYGFPDPPDLPSAGRPRAHGRVVFAGEIGYRKGVDRLAAALPRPVPGVAEECVLFGHPVRDFPVSALPHWWRLAGYTDRLGEEIASASALVLLSREEGMARVGQEALAAGTPLVVSPESGLGGWLRDGGGFVVDPDDPGAVEDALRRIAADPAHHSAAARRTAASWTWTDHARAVLAGFGGPG